MSLLFLSHNAAFLMIHFDSYHLEKDPVSSKERKVTEHLIFPDDIQAPLQHKKPPLQASTAAMLLQFTRSIPAYCSAKKSEN